MERAHVCLCSSLYAQQFEQPSSKETRDSWRSRDENYCSMNSPTWIPWLWNIVMRGSSPGPIVFVFLLLGGCFLSKLSLSRHLKSEAIGAISLAHSRLFLRAGLEKLPDQGEEGGIVAVVVVVVVVCVLLFLHPRTSAQHQIRGTWPRQEKWKMALHWKTSILDNPQCV